MKNWWAITSKHIRTITGIIILIDMSAAIIYMSMHGCTEKAARMLKNMHWEEVDLFNLGLQAPPTLEGYSTVIIGGSIHTGVIQGKIRKFCEEHEWELLTKRIGLYLCHMYDGEEAYKQFNDSFSEQLRQHAVAKGLFGGEFNLDKMSRQEKMLLEKAAGIDRNIENINTGAIEGFGKVIFHLDKS
jgi:menaquinone-dependent protoporphyrinogen oxidase